MYEALPAEAFKELFMAMLKYEYGKDKIIDTISNPIVRALFMAEKKEIDYNERKWAERAERNRKNGAQSNGRPRKEVIEEFDISQEFNPEFSNLVEL